ncbi:MAG: DUF72 domain-containing protein [Candidatus Acidiferrales bacterium]
MANSPKDIDTPSHRWQCQAMGTPPSRQGAIRIGFAGWSYPDWNGVFYPKPRPRGFQELAYIAQFFSVVEINSSFYRPPRAEWAKKWIGQVERHPDFHFTAKLWQGFTHERNATAEDERVFRQGFSPLAAEHRLGALLLQFPWSFKNTPDDRAYLANLIQRFGDYPLVVEVRHASWNEAEIFAWLREQHVGMCGIDQPLIGKSLRPAAQATSAIGYVRLHGRNVERWFAKNANASERYDYLYSAGELLPWVKRIEEIAQKTAIVYVIANNHPDAKAVVNAFQLENLISGKAVQPPAILIEHYPHLAEITSPPVFDRGERTGRLFPE